MFKINGIFPVNTRDLSMIVLGCNCQGSCEVCCLTNNTQKYFQSKAIPGRANNTPKCQPPHLCPSIIMPLPRQPVNTSCDMSISRVVGGASPNGWSHLSPGNTSTEFTCVHIYILHIYTLAQISVNAHNNHVTCAWK